MPLIGKRLSPKCLLRVALMWWWESAVYSHSSHEGMGFGTSGVLQEKYKAASKGNYDIYVVFVEKALSLLNAKGKLGFILPHKFFNAQYGEPLRGVIRKRETSFQSCAFWRPAGF